jgi:hypothetical protein
MIILMDRDDDKNSGETRKTIETISRKLVEVLKTGKTTERKE